MSSSAGNAHDFQPWRAGSKLKYCSKCGQSDKQASEQCPATDKLKKGNIIKVQAWWQDDQVVDVKIYHIYNDEMLMATPYPEGGHGRMIDKDKIVD